MTTRTFRVWIDDQCIGSGQCELVDGARFAIGEEGFAEVIGDPLLVIADDAPGAGELERQLTTLRVAASNCPIGAIHVDELT